MNSNEENFRKMWKWISEQSLKDQYPKTKQSYFYNNKIPDEEIPVNDDYACQEAYDRSHNKYMCDECPVQWFKDQDTSKWKAYCARNSTIYKQWLWCYSDYQKASDLAKQISELEWK